MAVVRSKRPRPAPVEDEIEEEEEAPPRPSRRPAKANGAKKSGTRSMTAEEAEIRGGWTEGQKQMDSTSSFAQPSARRGCADHQVPR